MFGLYFLGKEKGTMAIYDIEITGSNAQIEGEERSDNRPIIHWLPEEVPLA
mgnify:CR=1 FL=1